MSIQRFRIHVGLMTTCPNPRKIVCFGDVDGFTYSFFRKYSLFLSDWKLGREPPGNKPNLNEHTDISCNFWYFNRCCLEWLLSRDNLWINRKKRREWLEAVVEKKVTEIYSVGEYMNKKNNWSNDWTKDKSSGSRWNPVLKLASSYY